MPSYIRYKKRVLFGIESKQWYSCTPKEVLNMKNVSTRDRDTVLIVDDTSANHEVIQTFLNDIGVKCESAFDGLEAVTMCNSVDKNYYSLILMDINLPCMNGIETVRRIRSLGIDTPVIAVTASSKNEDRIRQAETESIFDMILFKPFNSTSFYTAISPYVRSALLTTSCSGSCAHRDSSFPGLDPDVCDIHTAIENMGNSPRLFLKHFNNFKHNNADLSLRLREMIDTDQYSDAAVLCHSIKGLAGMLGFTSLYSHVISLENLLRQHISERLFILSYDILALLFCINNDIQSICQLQI